MRGQQSLFSSKFVSDPSPSGDGQRPRNVYQPQRNKALIARYYFHAEINRYRYDDCISLLESEFYITAPRIINVLSNNSNRINDIITDDPTPKDLEKEHPHFNWKAR
jgi:hypothetical protein